ncbi:unnamed protein product, partial [Enterobius vermicularis]|uniref:7TM_GPCR_Srx domain-containing protein n=1 Tax=Enterobius vermicularis TaxID=51028 RepID=A0A0N4VH76_ENTVE
ERKFHIIKPEDPVDYFLGESWKTIPAPNVNTTQRTLTVILPNETTNNEAIPTFHQGCLQVTTAMAVLLCRALITFNKKLVRAHWFFDFASLTFNSLVLITYLVVLSNEGRGNWDTVNITFIVCFAAQIPLQLWAISVVKSCYNFFNLLHVFIRLAEK